MGCVKLRFGHFALEGTITELSPKVDGLESYLFNGTKVDLYHNNMKTK